MVKVNDVPAGGSRLHRFALFASVVVIGVIGTGAGMPAAAAQPTAAGPEFAVSSPAVSANPSPTVAANDRGQVVVLWLGECGGSVGVCARSYDAAGSPLTPETFLDLQTEPLSRAPAAALSFAGKLIVVWPAFDPLQSITTITARLFTLDLHPAGGAVAVGSTGAATQLLDRPAIANLPGGRAVVVWEEYGLDGVPFALRGQLLDATAHAVGARFRVDAGPAAPTAPAVAADAGGRFAVAWDTYAFTASLDDVAARVFDPLGHPLGDPFVVHQQTADVQESPAVAASPGGEFLVAWLSHLSVGAGPGVYVRKVSAAGPLGPSESKVSPPTAGQDFGPAAAGGAAGFTVAWETAVGNGSAVSYRSLDLAGVAQGGAQPLASTLGLFDQRPAVAADVAGNLFVAWNRRNPDFHRQIVGRRFLASPPGVCATSPNVLCLGGGRFQVEVAWHDQHNGPSGRGTAIPGSDKTGYFWFFSDTNVELVVKILDARTVNGFFWFFYGALSDVEYTITVTDVATGERRFYDNPAGNLCGLGDTRAFPLGGPAAPLAPGGDGTTVAADALFPWPSMGALSMPVLPVRPRSARSRTTVAAGTCAADAHHLCLLGDRFRVSVAWHDQHNGGDGVGTAVPFVDRTGFFWFFNQDNVELVVKVLDARTVNGNFWVFYGALSDVEYTITVTDTESGFVRTYHNEPGEICGRGDTSAIPGGP